ncbi:MAG: hypothetical protein ABIP82_07410 [Nitrospirales bacterium]
MRTRLNEYKDVGNVKIGGLHHSPFEGEGQRAIGEAHGLCLESILTKPRTILVRVGINGRIRPGIHLWMGSSMVLPLTSLLSDERKKEDMADFLEK